MKRKAQLLSYNLLSYTWRMIFLVVAVFTIIYLIKFFTNVHVETHELRPYIFSNNIVNSLSYYDPEINRFYKGILDPNKINQIENLIYYGEENNVICANISLFDENQNLLSEFFYNKKKYDQWKPLTWSEDYFSEKFQFMIIVKDFDQLVKQEKQRITNKNIELNKQINEIQKALAIAGQTGSILEQTRLTQTIPILEMRKQRGLEQ